MEVSWALAEGVELGSNILRLGEVVKREVPISAPLETEGFPVVNTFISRRRGFQHKRSGREGQL